MRYANVVSTLALFLSLTGGAYAVTQLSDNSVASRHIQTGAVTSADIKNGSLTSFDGLPGRTYFRFNDKRVPLKNSGFTKILSQGVTGSRYLVIAEVEGEPVRGTDPDTTCRVVYGSDNREIALFNDTRRIPATGPAFPPSVHLVGTGVTSGAIPSTELRLECFAIAGSADPPMTVTNARVSAIQLRELQIQQQP